MTFCAAEKIPTSRRYFEVCSAQKPKGITTSETKSVPVYFITWYIYLDAKYLGCCSVHRVVSARVIFVGVAWQQTIDAGSSRTASGRQTKALVRIPPIIVARPPAVFTSVDDVR